MTDRKHTLKLKRIGINTYQEPVVYMRMDCHICRSEGFDAQSRIVIRTRTAEIIATLNIVHDSILEPGYMGLSDAAWRLLKACEGEEASVSHAEPVDSLSFVRSKIYGKSLSQESLRHIMLDISKGRYSDVSLAAFITACSGNRLSRDEIHWLTQSMVDVGQRMDWPQQIILDKHCVGGLPGNRTTPIVVAIVSACGGMIPKTSSRAITSPSGTADTVEVLMPVNLSLVEMRRVVEQHGGCLIWGGAADLSPADDILIRVERALDLDSEGQLIASVLSKKVAAGATHVILDLPVGPTAKIRSAKSADHLQEQLQAVGQRVDLNVRVLKSDGRQPVGRGIGPALEALDVLAVLQNLDDAPHDLRDKSLALSAELLEMGELALKGQGLSLARQTLESGRAWQQFQAIAEAQGGLLEPPSASHYYTYEAEASGTIDRIDNRMLARLAKLAGAPSAKAAGVFLHAKLQDVVEQGQPLLSLQAETPGELNYAMAYLQKHPNIVGLKKKEG